MEEIPGEEENPPVEEIPGEEENPPVDETPATDEKDETPKTGIVANIGIAVVTILVAGTALTVLKARKNK